VPDARRSKDKLVFRAGADSASAVVLGLLTALVVAAPRQASVAQAKPPALTEIVPPSGPAGEAYPLQATIRGTSFMASRNTVRFGPVTIGDLPSADGARITFHVPKLMPSTSEVPPMVLTPGDYPVTVMTSAGTSNALMFTLTLSP
jgi:hypothetical protein